MATRGRYGRPGKWKWNIDLCSQSTWAQVRPPCSCEYSPATGLPMSILSSTSPIYPLQTWGQVGMQFQGEAANLSCVLSYDLLEHRGSRRLTRARQASAMGSDRSALVSHLLSKPPFQVCLCLFSLPIFTHRLPVLQTPGTEQTSILTTSSLDHKALARSPEISF